MVKSKERGVSGGSEGFQQGSRRSQRRFKEVSGEPGGLRVVSGGFRRLQGASGGLRGLSGDSR